MINKYVKCLLRIDPKYFEPLKDGYKNRRFTQQDACYYLATWLYDNNAAFDEETYQLLEKIPIELYCKTLYNLFHRNHDT